MLSWFKNITLWMLLLTFSVSSYADQCSDVFPSSPVSGSSFRLTPLGSSASSLNLNRNSNVSYTADSSIFYSSGSIGRNTTININGSGTVRMHFAGNLNIGRGLRLNSSGNPEDLVIYVGGSLQISRNADVNALIYVAGSVTLGRDSDFDGGLTAGGSISADRNVDYSYDSGAVSAANFAGMCDGASTPLPAPVLEYRFDECSLSSGVTDSAGSYDGTANSAESSADELVINRSLDLSATGTLDYVTVNRGALNGLNDFSISTWIKTGTSKAQQEVFQALGNSTGDDEIEIYLINSSQVRLNVGDRGNTVNAGKTLTDNNWHHLLITRSGNDMCLYVDGGVAGCHDDGSGSQISISNSSSAIIGQEQDSFGGSFNSGQAFDGYIDEFKVYASELSSSHALQIYTNENGGLNADGTSRSASNCTVTVPTPYSEHRMDETSWDGTSGEIEDNIGSNDGSVVDTGSGNVTNIADGKICRAGSVGANSGTNTYYAIDSQVDIDDEIGDTGSISFWYRSADTWGNNSSRKVLLSASSTGRDDKYFFITMETSGRLRYGLENTSDADYRYSSSTSFSYPSTEWVHIVATWDMANRNMQLYVNGAQEINATFSQNRSIGEMLTLYLGDNRSDYVAGEGNVSADGDFDELLTFRQVLTSAQVTEIYTNQNAGNNYDGSSRGGCTTASLSPVAEWRFDEARWGNAVGQVRDNIGSNHGTAQGGVSTIYPGQICHAGEFVADDEHYVSGLDLSQLQTTASLSFWIKTNQTGDNTAWRAPGVAGVEEAGGGDDIFWGWLDATGYIGITVGDDYGTTKSTVQVNTGEWKHVVLTRNATSGAYQIFIDGVLNKSGTGGSGNIGNSFSSLGRIEDTGGSPEYLDGQLDEVLIFNEVLSATDVAGIYNNQKDGVTNWDGTARGDCASTVSYYEISHTSPSLTCEAAAITVTARDASDQVITPSSGTEITLTAELISGSNVTNTFTPSSFTFDGTQSSTTVQLTRTSPGELDIDVTDGTVTDQDGQSTDPNIVFSDIAFRFYANNVVDNIGTQIAGKLNTLAPGNQTITIRAIETDTATGQCATLKPASGFTIDFGYECESPNTCSGLNLLTVNDADISGFAGGNSPVYDPDPVTVDFDATGTGTLVINYRDAGQIELFARADVPVSNGTGSVEVTGSSTPFVVRPFAFGFPSITASGAVMSLPAGDETGGNGFTSAGSEFVVAVNAYAYDSADDSDSDGVPDADANLTNNDVTPNFTGTVNLTRDSFTPAGGTQGTLSGDTGLLLGTYANRSGADVAATLQYDEVGSINLLAQLDDYLSAADADIQSVPTKIGRFYPDHFVLTESAVQEQCTPFTYMQQPFSALEYKIEARSADGELTENYDLALYSNTAVLELSAEDSDDGNELSSRLTTPTSLSGWAEGVIDRTTASSTAISDLIFQRQGGSAGLEDGPYTQLQLGISITSELDSRNFTSSALNIDPDLAGDCTGSCTGVALGNATELRYGRVILQSAHGPETEDLPVPFEIQYWDGAAFVRNTDDSCSTIPLANISFDGNAISSVVADRTVTVGDGSTVGNLSINGTNSDAASGDFSLIFTAPGAGTGGNDNTGYFPVGLSSIDEWLRYDWDQDGDANDTSVPDAIITFGRARGNDRMIFWQERYQ